MEFFLSPVAAGEVKERNDKDERNAAGSFPGANRKADHNDNTLVADGMAPTQESQMEEKKIVGEYDGEPGELKLVEGGCHRPSVLPDDFGVCEADDGARVEMYYADDG